MYTGMPCCATTAAAVRNFSAMPPVTSCSWEEREREEGDRFEFDASFIVYVEDEIDADADADK